MIKKLLALGVLSISTISINAQSFNHNGKIDWSVAMVESTMKRYPTPKDLGSWGYAKSLYLYGQYLVYKRTRDPRYLKIGTQKCNRTERGSAGSTVEISTQTKKRTRRYRARF